MTAFSALLTFLLVNGVQDIEADRAKNMAKLQLDKPPLTHDINAIKEVKLALLIDENGRIVKGENRYHQKHAKFYHLALHLIKSKTFPIKKNQGKAVQYWIDEYTVEIGNTREK